MVRPTYTRQNGNGTKSHISGEHGEPDDDAISVIVSNAIAESYFNSFFWFAFGVIAMLATFFLWDVASSRVERRFCNEAVRLGHATVRDGRFVWNPVPFKTAETE